MSQQDCGWYERVIATPAEIAEHRDRFGRDPGTYRYTCKLCGKRLWGSGLGIGSHTRKHRRQWAMERQAQGA